MQVAKLAAQHAHYKQQMADLAATAEHKLHLPLTDEMTANLNRHAVPALPVHRRFRFGKQEEAASHGQSSLRSYCTW